MKRLVAFTALLLLSLSLAAQPIAVSGKVLLHGGAPAARALVEFSGPDRARATTTDDGSYYIARLAKGAYTVQITYRGSSSSQQVRVADGTLNLYIG